MRHIEFLEAEIAEVEKLIARYALSCSDARLLLSVPVPGGPTIAHFADPEGHVVGLVKGM